MENKYGGNVERETRGARKTLCSRFAANPEISELYSSAPSSFVELSRNYDGLNDASIISTLRLSGDNLEHLILNPGEKYVNGGITTNHIADASALLSLNENIVENSTEIDGIGILKGTYEIFEKYGGIDECKKRILDYYISNPEKIDEIVDGFVGILSKNQREVCEPKNFEEYDGGVCNLAHHYAGAPLFPLREIGRLNFLIALDNQNKGIVRAEHYRKMDSAIKDFSLSVSDAVLNSIEKLDGKCDSESFKAMPCIANIAANYGYDSTEIVRKMDSAKEVLQPEDSYEILFGDNYDAK